MAISGIRMRSTCAVEVFGILDRSFRTDFRIMAETRLTVDRKGTEHAVGIGGSGYTTHRGKSCVTELL
jgi:hypothetical protein